MLLQNNVIRTFIVAKLIWHVVYSLFIIQWETRTGDVAGHSVRTERRKTSTVYRLEM